MYNKINASIQGGGELPALAITYQNQAALYRSEGVVIDLTPFIQKQEVRPVRSGPGGLLPLLPGKR